MDSVRWVARDREGNEVYLTEERWAHITDPTNHPEMEEYEEELRLTIQQARRRQDPLNTQKYIYTQAFANLIEDNTHVVAIVLFRFRESLGGRPLPNNFIVTAYQKEIG